MPKEGHEQAKTTFDIFLSNQSGYQNADNKNKFRRGLKSALMHTKLALIRQNNSLDFAQFSLMKVIDLADRQNEIVAAAKRLRDSDVLPKSEPAVQDFFKQVESWVEFAQEDESVLERLAKAATTLETSRPLQVEVDGKLCNVVDCDDQMASLMQRIGLYSHNYDAKQKAQMDE